MRSILAAIIVAISGLSLGVVEGAVSLTGLNDTYTQNFDSLANVGTSSDLPANWVFVETGTSANTTYTAGTGSGNTGDTYSLGASGSTERALGELTSGSVQSTFGFSALNASGSVFPAFTISYVGEQWRLASATSDKLDFQYSLNATDLSSGTWVNFDALDFIAPVTTGTVGQLDGNASANRVAINQTIGGVDLADGATIWFRWVSVNVANDDYGLALDDFSITAVPEPAEWGLICAVGLLGVCGLRTWRERRRASRQLPGLS